MSAIRVQDASECGDGLGGYWILDGNQILGTASCKENADRIAAALNATATNTPGGGAGEWTGCNYCDGGHECPHHCAPAGEPRRCPAECNKSDCPYNEPQPSESAPSVDLEAALLRSQIDRMRGEIAALVRENERLNARVEGICLACGELRHAPDCRMFNAAPAGAEVGDGELELLRELEQIVRDPGELTSDPRAAFEQARAIDRREQAIIAELDAIRAGRGGREGSK